MILLDLSASMFVPWGKGAVRIGVAVIGVGGPLLRHGDGAVYVRSPERCR